MNHIAPSVKLKRDDTERSDKQQNKYKTTTTVRVQNHPT